MTQYAWAMHKKIDGVQGGGKCRGTHEGGQRPYGGGTNFDRL